MKQKRDVLFADALDILFLDVLAIGMAIKKTMEIARNDYFNSYSAIINFSKIFSLVFSANGRKNS